MVMLENSVYSVLSPEGFASILWKDKDGSRVHEAAELMKLTANDLYEMKIIDKIITEPRGAITKNREYVYKRLRIYLRNTIEELMKLSKTSLLNKRFNIQNLIKQSYKQLIN